MPNFGIAAPAVPLSRGAAINMALGNILQGTAQGEEIARKRQKDQISFAMQLAHLQDQSAMNQDRLRAAQEAREGRRSLAKLAEKFYGAPAADLQRGAEGIRQMGQATSIPSALDVEEGDTEPGPLTLSAPGTMESEARRLLVQRQLAQAMPEEFGKALLSQQFRKPERPLAGAPGTTFLDPTTGIPLFSVPEKTPTELHASSPRGIFNRRTGQITTPFAGTDSKASNPFNQIGLELFNKTSGFTNQEATRINAEIHNRRLELARAQAGATTQARSEEKTGGIEGLQARIKVLDDRLKILNFRHDLPDPLAMVPPRNRTTAQAILKEREAAAEELARLLGRNVSPQLPAPSPRPGPSLVPSPPPQGGNPMDRLLQKYPFLR